MPAKPSHETGVAQQRGDRTRARIAPLQNMPDQSRQAGYFAGTMHRTLTDALDHSAQNQERGNLDFQTRKKLSSEDRGEGWEDEREGGGAKEGGKGEVEVEDVKVMGVPFGLCNKRGGGGEGRWKGKP